MVVEWDHGGRESCIITPSRLGKYSVHTALSYTLYRYDLQYAYVTTGGSDRIKNGEMEYHQMQNKKRDIVGSIGIHRQPDGTLVCVDLFFSPFVIPNEYREKIANEVDGFLQ